MPDKMIGIAPIALSGIISSSEEE